MTHEDPGSDRRRIEALEKVVRALVGEVEALRGELARLGVRPASTPLEAAVRTVEAAREPLPTAAAEAPSPQSRASEPAATSGGQPPRVPHHAPSTIDLEQLVGRYGTVAVATMAILLGVGAFLQWAIARDLLGPAARVALGVVAAVVLAGVGLRLRTGSPRFGNALLAIALAVAHLDAWAAGPGLGLVSPYLALGLAAAASVALASLALRDGEEFLFCLGLGGALVAPWVTMEGEGTPGQLLLFGFAVLTAAIVAMRNAAWRWGPRLAAAFALAYALSAWGARAPEGGRYWAAAFALGLGAVAVALGARGVRRSLVGNLLLLLACALVVSGDREGTTLVATAGYGLMGTVLLVALRRRSAASGDGEETFSGLVGVPLVLLGSALVAAEVWDEPRGALVSAAWAGLATVLAWIEPEERRPHHVSVVLTAAVLAALALAYGHDAWPAVATAAMAGLTVAALVRLPGLSLLVPLALALFLATGNAWTLLDARDAYDYVPFATSASLASLAAVLAWFAASRWLPPLLFEDEGRPGPWGGDVRAVALRAAAPVAAFLWGRAELAQAVSVDVATFLLITYYAAWGVGTILRGRANASGNLRQVGLALALYAAFKTVMEASDLDAIGYRVGSYLVVGVFLLGVGYLYRAPARESAPSP